MPPLARLSLFLFVALTSFGLLASVGTPTAAARPCWERVIDDWTDNGRIDARYSPACLQAALDHVPEDVRAYSDFEEKIKQAIQESLRSRRLQGAGGSNPTVTRARRVQVDRLERDEPSAAEAPEEESPIDRALGYRNEDASSVPLPLIILAAFAVLLLAAGASGFAHRKLRTRKPRSR